MVPELNGKQNPRRNDCPSSSPHTAGVSKVPHGRVPSRGFCGQGRDVPRASVPRASVPAAPRPLTALLPLSLLQRGGWSENFQESSPPLFLSYMSSILSSWERKNSPDSFHLGAGVAPRAGPWPLRTTLWRSPPKHTQLCRPHHQRQTLCDHSQRRRDTPGWRSGSPDRSRCLRAAHVTGHSRPPAQCGWSCSHRSQLCLLSLAPLSAKEKLLRNPPTLTSWKHPAQRKPLLPQRLQKYSKQAFTKSHPTFFTEWFYHRCVTDGLWLNILLTLCILWTSTFPRKQGKLWTLRDRWILKPNIKNPKFNHSPTILFIEPDKWMCRHIS